MSNTAQLTLTRLRDDFILRLPGRITLLKSLLDGVTRGESGAVEALHREAHSLAGVAGTHRLMQVFEAARKLELIVAVVSTSKGATDTELTDMRVALADIVTQAQQPNYSFVPPTVLRQASQHIVVVDDDVEQADWLRSVLEQDGYQVEVFNELNAFRDACQKQGIPAAVIMDMIFPEGDDAGARVIAEMKEQCLGVVPVIFLSLRDDIAAKLAAYRAGATRYLTKPVQREKLLQVVNESAALMPTEPYRVLLVDDDPDQLAIHALLLRQDGMEVRTASDPLQVPQILGDFAAEILLLDMYMPQCSGPELAAILRDDDRYAGIPVIYLSAETDIAKQLQALDRVGDLFLTKPVEPGYLIAVVGIHARRFRQALEQVESLRSTRYERERQQQALDAHAIVSASDATGNIIYVNDNFCKISGHTREELLGKNHRIVKSGVHPPELYADMWRTIKSGKIWHGELCNQRKDGSLYWVTTSIVPFMDTGGGPYQYVSIRTDVTNIKQQEAQLHMLLDNAADAVFVAGKDERWTYVNDRAVAMLGYSREELLGKSIYDLVPVDWRETYRQSFREKLLADGGMHQEIRFVKKDGRKIPIGMNAAVLPDGAVYVSCRDISLRKQAEAERKEALDRLQKIADRVPGVVFQFRLRPDGSSCFPFASEATRELFRVSPEEIREDGAKAFAICHPDDLYALMESIRLSAQNLAHWNHEVRTKFDDGTVRWLLGNGLPQREADGSVLWHGFISDITERKHSEAALLQTQQLLNSIVENIPVMVFLKRASDLCFELFNRAGEKMLGYSRNDLLGKNDYDFFSGERADFFTAQDRKVLASEEVVEIPEEPIKIASGETRYLHTWKTALRNADGEPTHLLGISLDITERKQAEASLQKSRAKLEAAQAQARLGNWEADFIANTAYWSDEAFRIYGHEPGQFKPTPQAFFSAVHPDDMGIVNENSRIAAETGVLDFVHRIIRPDGEIRYVHELARSRFDAEGKLVGLAGTTQDVTELKLVEQALIAAKEQAESASRAKSEFLASMSHELRTPLNAILGFSQLFAMDSQLPMETRNNAQEIERAGQHLLSLVNDMIDLARIEAGRLELSLEPVPLRTVMKDSLAMVASLASTHHINVIEADCSEKEITVLADYVRLRQVVINLLSNAIKYNKPQGSVHVSCRINESTVRISVTDTGTGIPADKQSRIFKSFDRLGEERGKIEGTGIGLVITKRIVEAMGGSIGFESIEGQGSIFWLELPLTESNHAQVLANLAPESAPSPAFGTTGVKTGRSVVMYIEDNPMNMRLMQQILASRKNLALRDAHSAEIGIESAFADPPDMILMDINLPGMNGYQALAILKADVRTAHIPVIAISANAMMGDKEHGLQAGFADYLTKPLDIRYFNKVVDACLDKPLNQSHMQPGDNQ